MQPALKPGRGEQGVELHGQLEAFFGGVKGIDLESAQLFERRVSDPVDQLSQIQVFALLPELFEEGGKQNALSAAHRVGCDPGEAQQGGDGAADLLSDRLDLGGPVELWGGQAAHDVDRGPHL